MSLATRVESGRERWTVVELIRWGANYLREKGFENPRLEIERILAHVLGLDRVGLYLQHDRPLTAEELQFIRQLVQRRLQREPLAYILGEWEFFGLRLKVGPGVLVPRPETERLVEVALDLSRQWSRVRFADLGTGSGNIAVALAANLPTACGVAVDLSRRAAAVARENVVRHQLEARVAVVVGDMRRAPVRMAAEGGLDLIVSNPPYVRPDEWPGLQPEITNYEPKEALVAEPDGLSCYRAIGRVAAHALRPGGAVVVEIGADQAEDVVQIFRQAGLEDVAVHRDLAGRDRVVSAWKKSDRRERR